MEANVKPIETTTTDLQETTQTAEALRELASFELTLVGGGAAVAFM